MKRSPVHEARSLKKRDAKLRLEAHLARGRGIMEALRLIDRSHRTYREWCDEDPAFKMRVARLRSKAEDPSLTGIDFIRFRSAYFDRDTPAHHSVMVEAIETAKVGSVTMILAPPAHGKTSLLVDYVCWKLAENPNFRVAIVSEAEDLAKKILGQITRRMTDDTLATNRRYIETYGPFRAPDRELQKPWNTERITLLQSNHDEKEPSVEVKGAGGQIYGARYDLIIFDDIQSTKNLSATAKLLQYFRQDVYTRLTDVTRFIIVGTRVGPGDFYETLLAEDALVDHFVKLPAVTTTNAGTTRVPLWPEHWPLERLDGLRRKVGEETWARVYQQEPVSAASATFTDEMIAACADAERVVGGPIPGTGVVCALDPALSGDSAFMACAFSADRLWVLDAETHTDIPRVEDMLNIIERFSGAYHPSLWVVEKNIGRATARDDRLEAMGSAGRFNFDVVEHVTTGRNKYEPVMGVGAMASMFARGEISYPAGDDESRRRMAPLTAQLRAWRANVPGRLLTQDMVICLWMIWHWWQRYRESLIPTVSAPQFRPSWLMSA